MIDLAGIFLILAIIVGVGPSAAAGLRNATGIFVVYGIIGIFTPTLIVLITGRPGRSDVVTLLSPYGFHAVILSVFSFITAIYVSKSFGRPKFTIETKVFFKENPAISIYCSFISMILSALYIILMSVKYGGFFSLLERLYQRVNFEDSSANFLQTITIGSFVFSIFAIIFSKSLHGFPLWISRISAFSFIVLCFLLGGRSNLGLFFVAVLYVPFIKMKITRAILAVLVVTAIFGTTSYAMISLRKEAQGNRVQATSIADAMETATTGVAFVDHVAASIEYASVRGHDSGQLYLNILTSPVPRDLWPEKPLPISTEMRDFLFGDTLGGNPPGLFGEAYIAFGSIGTIFAAALLGWLLGMINRVTALAVRFDCRLRTALAGIFAPLIAFSLVRGGFDVTTTRLAVAGIFCVLAAFLCFYLSAKSNVSRPHSRRVMATKRATRRPSARQKPPNGRYPGRLGEAGGNLRS